MSMGGGERRCREEPRRGGHAAATRPAALLLALALGAGCEPPSTVVRLLHVSGAPQTYTPPPGAPLEVVARTTSVRDPMPVDGSPISYGELEPALAHAVASAAVPWAESHPIKAGASGYQIVVEMTRAEARFDGSRTEVWFDLGVTLRTRERRRYIAQTHVRCDEAAPVAPNDGGPLVYSCLTGMSRDLAGWLGGIDPS